MFHGRRDRAMRKTITTFPTYFEIGEFWVFLEQTAVVLSFGPSTVGSVIPPSVDHTMKEPIHISSIFAALQQQHIRSHRRPLNCFQFSMSSEYEDKCQLYWSLSRGHHHSQGRVGTCSMDWLRTYHSRLTQLDYENWGDIAWTGGIKRGHSCSANTSLSNCLQWRLS